MTLTGQPYSTRTMNLGQFLTQAAALYPQHDVLIRGEKKVTFEALGKRVDAACHALTARGVQKGDRVLVQSRNSFAMFEAMFAVWKLGAVLVPVNFRLTPDDVAYIAGNCGASVLLYEPLFEDHRAAIDKAVVLNLTIALSPVEGVEDWDAVVASASDDRFPSCAVDRDDPCWFFFTSGTTGHPKAAVLTHGQMNFVVTNYLADLFPGLDADRDASLVVAPLSHGAGIHQIAQVARGVVSVFPQGQRFDPAEVFALIEEHKITNAFTVPTILKTLVEHEAVDRFDHSSLRHLIYAGAPMFRVDQRRALEKLGPCIVQYFGLGEVTGNITVFPAHRHHVDDEQQGRIGSCGTARAGMQVQIQDDDGVELPAGETGEICVIGPAVFAGYYNNDEANAKAFRNGWFRTGDRGHMDEAGFVYITGRESDMYISGGSNIYPREIEEKLLEHPAVSDCAVVGMPDDKWGEVGVAALVVTPDFDEAEFHAWMEQKIASYKRPRRVELFDALPVSGYGKVTKKLVRAALEERLKGE
ncbi:MAG: acyl-CoA synthetase [Pseudomonadota bacterium]